MPDQKTIAHNVDYIDTGKFKKNCVYREIVECPSCHYAIEPKELESFVIYPEERQYSEYQLIVIHLCKHCRHIFMSCFRGCSYNNINGELTFKNLIYSIPSTPRSTVFTEAVRALSPSFVETYLQAEIAESHQLAQIYGVGYRKSLEYLVKDYLYHMNPEATDAIYKEPLSASIRRIADSRIKTLAERSTWIGNDETHCVRKHEDLNVDDMKRFIRAMLTYVESELAFEEALGIERK